MASEPLTRDAVEAIIRDWPPTPRAAATTVIGKYGPPQEATPSLLLWSGTGPWKWTMLWRDEAPTASPSRTLTSWSRPSTTGSRPTRRVSWPPLTAA